MEYYSSAYSLSLADPIGAQPIEAALAWLQGTLLGTVATTVAVMAVASVGFALLTGRLEVRRGLTTITGCFVLFGASSIATALRDLVADGGDAPLYVPPSTPLTLPEPIAPGPGTRDPYAGASVPSGY